MGTIAKFSIILLLWLFYNQVSNEEDDWLYCLLRMSIKFEFLWGLKVNKEKCKEKTAGTHQTWSTEECVKSIRILSPFSS